jgi:hypothetical protein
MSRGNENSQELGRKSSDTPRRKKSVWERACEMELTPDARARLSGTYWNNKQFRLERWIHGRLMFWMTMELLKHLNEMDDDKLLQAISDHEEPGASTLADFFFPGWQIRHYVRTGERIES